MRLAPNELTLAEIAAEAGVTAGAVAQRFGSKRALLLALAKAAAASTGDFIAQLRAEHRSPLAAVRAYTGCMAGLAQSPAALARNLAYLQIDLADRDFAALVRGEGLLDDGQPRLGHRPAAVDRMGLADVDDEELHAFTVLAPQLLQPTG